MKWLELILKYLPVVLQTVVAVEGVVKAPGASKKQIVMGVITAGAKGAEQIPEGHVQAIGTLVDTTVGMLNASGVFTKETVPSS